MYISGTPGTQCVFEPVLCPWNYFKDAICDTGCVVGCKEPQGINYFNILVRYWQALTLQIQILFSIHPLMFIEMSEENMNNRRAQEKRGVNSLCDVLEQNCKDGLRCIEVQDNCDNTVGMCQADKIGKIFL